MTDLGLAVNRVWYNKQTKEKQEDVTFVDVTVWGKQAELACEYLSKGRSLLVEGRLQMDTWQDRETGANRSKLKVVAEDITFVGARQGGEQQRSPADSYYDKPKSQPSQEEIPF